MEYGLRIAQLEAAWEFVARGVVRAARRSLLDAVDRYSSIASAGNQQFAMYLQNAARMSFADSWQKISPVLAEMHNRSAALATRQLSRGIGFQLRESSREDVADDALAATDELTDTLDGLIAVPLGLLLLSASQSRRRFAGILVNGLALDQLWASMATAQSGRVFNVIAAVSADSQISGSPVDARALILNMTEDATNRPTMGAMLSGQSDVSMLGSVKKHIGTIVHAVGNDASQAVSELNADSFTGITGEIHTAILDELTCPVCRNLDGTFYPFVDGASTSRSLPIHFSCRCKYTPAVESDGSPESAAPIAIADWFAENELVQKSVFPDGLRGERTFPNIRKVSRIRALSFQSLRDLTWKLS